MDMYSSTLEARETAELGKTSDMMMGRLCSMPPMMAMPRSSAGFFSTITCTHRAHSGSLSLFLTICATVATARQELWPLVGQNSEADRSYIGRQPVQAFEISPLSTKFLIFI